MYFTSIFICITSIAHVYIEGKKEGSYWNIELRHAFDIRQKDQFLLDQSLTNFLVLSSGAGWDDEESDTKPLGEQAAQDMNSLPYTF